MDKDNNNSKAWSDKITLESSRYPIYFAKGKGLEGMTAQDLARELDIHVDRVEIALENLIDKGLVCQEYPKKQE